jgi:hypothetical protein
MQNRKKRRTTQQVKDDILQAVGDVLAKYGASKLGVEAVAAAAGMDKAMLYRHYKDFNDLLKNYIDQEDFWLKFLDEDFHIEGKSNLAHSVSKMFEGLLMELLKNKKFQELIIWEFADKSQLMKDVAQRREEMAHDILTDVQKYFPYKSVSSNNIMAIISAGIYYLTLHKDISTFCTIDLNNLDHQKDFLADLNWLIDKVFSPISESERIALNCLKRGMDKQLISEITGLSLEQLHELK